MYVRAWLRNPDSGDALVDLFQLGQFDMGPHPHRAGFIVDSVFGKVVAGIDVVKKIARVNRGRSDRPTKDVVLTSVEIFRSATKPTA